MSNPRYADGPRRASGGAWVIVLVAVVGAMLAIPLLLGAGLWFIAIRAESSGPIQASNAEERAEAVHAAPEPAAAVPVSEATQETAD